MTKTEDDFAAHMLDLSEEMRKFVSGSGMSGWRTTLNIFFYTIVSPDALPWVANNGLTDLPEPPKNGDNIHWYKKKYDVVENIRRSVPLSILKGNTSMFKRTDIPQVVTDCVKPYVTKNAIYFLGSEKSKICSINETDLNASKVFKLDSVDAKNSEILDVSSSGDYDFFLTSSKIYRLKSKEKLESSDSEISADVFYSPSTSLNAFCISDSVMIIATDSGGIRLAGITGSSHSGETKIEHKQTTATVTAPSDGSGGGSSSESSGGASTSITVTNGVPKGASKFVWPDGSGKYYIGNDSTSGHFSFSATDFEPSSTGITADYVDKHDEFVTSSVNKSYCGESYIEKDGKTLFGKNTYAVTGVTNAAEIDDFIYFSTSSGVKIFSKEKIDNLYGPDSEYLTISGISESINGVFSAYGNIFVVGSSGKFMTTDPEVDENKTKLYLFGTDFDPDVKAQDTDIKEVKLSFKEYMSIGRANSPDVNKISNAKNKPATYAIGVVIGSPMNYNLYGNDDRNAPALELKGGMEGFDIEME